MRAFLPLLAALAVAAVMGATFLAWRGAGDNARADAAEARANALAAQVEELQEAQYHAEAAGCTFMVTFPNDV